MVLSANDQTYDRTRTVPAHSPSPFPQRILFADDDEDTRIVMIEALVEDGHDVIRLENGDQLLECLGIIARDSLRGPDLIVMDVCMPGLSGIDILEELRDAGWATPVVLATGFASHELRSRAAKAGSAAIIQKPFDLDELRAAARSALAT